MGNKVYPQMPYTQTTPEDYHEAELALMPIDLEPLYTGDVIEAQGEAFCTTDACEIQLEIVELDGVSA
jgi:hypothetical protein